MNKKYLLVPLVILVALTAFFLFNVNTEKKQVCFNNTCVNVEIADTPQKRERGLMFVNTLEKNSGMLFIFDTEDNYPFWMKNTLIPLDILWIDKNFTIVHLETATPCESDPCKTYDPKTPAKYVLEVNAQFAEKNNIKLEDKVEIRNHK